MDCRLLTSVTIGAGVDEIGDGAFAGYHTFRNDPSCPIGDYDYRLSSSGWSHCIQEPSDWGNALSNVPTVIQLVTGIKKPSH